MEKISARKPLDGIDLRILQLLQADATLTNKEIAAQLRLTITPVYERIKRLQKAGYIRKTVAILDRELLGLDFLVFCSVSIKEHANTYIKQFEEEVLALEEVQEIYHISGSYDYLLKVLVADIHMYRDFITNKLSKLGNLGHVQSSFVMKELKQTHALPMREMQ